MTLATPMKFIEGFSSIKDAMMPTLHSLHARAKSIWWFIMDALLTSAAPCPTLHDTETKAAGKITCDAPKESKEIGATTSIAQTSSQ